jgi:hypothetical protein
MTASVRVFPGGCTVRGNHVFRHRGMPPVEDIDPSTIDGVVFHTMVTVNAGDVEGQLLRWIGDDGEVGYEARIDGLEEQGGVCDVAAYSISSIACLARVANEIRYECEIVTGVHGDKQWTVY